MPAWIRIVGSVAGAALFAGGCSHDWNTYDPRLGDGGASSGTGATGGSGGSAGAGAGGVAGSTTGGGGTTTGGGTAGGGGTTTGGGGTTTGGGGTTTGGGGTTSGGGSAGSGATGGGTGSKTYGATVADCTSTQTPDPDLCKTYTYDVGMSVDQANSDYAVDGGADEPTVAYLRFELDNTFAGATVTSVTLTLTTTSNVDSQSNSSGEVWAVPCFTRTDLFNAAPGKSGSSALAGSQGAVVPSQTVNWSLPVGSVSAGQPACFGVFPTSSNGVDYYNNDGTTPPSLTIDYQ
jgi:hypothetical protein